MSGQHLFRNDARKRKQKHRSRLTASAAGMDEYAPGKVAKDLADIESEAEAGGCVSCGLCNSRSTAVFGSGDPDPRLMFVGEGLGAEEDRQGLPFVGAAGELLTKIRTTYHPAALLRYPK